MNLGYPARRPGLVRRTIERLRAMPLLAHCDEYELRDLARSFSERIVSEGDVLCRVGEPAREVYLVDTARLSVVVGGEQIAVLDSGALAGELGPLGTRRRTADLVVTASGSVLVTSAESLRELLAECPGLRRAVTPLLADRAEENHRRSTA